LEAGSLEDVVTGRRYVMLVVRARLHVRPDKRADFLDAITDVIHDSRHVPGVSSYEICESITEPNVFVAVEVYDSADARIRHRSSEIYQRALPTLKECLADPPEGGAYRVASSEPLEL
jgi:quinol monooxygenase YgiN